MLMTAGMETEDRIASAKCFFGMCTLTEILGDILPLIYDRCQKSEADLSKTLRRLETELDKWEDSEPAVSMFVEDGPPVSGISSLKLGFLSVRMLICRIAFRVSFSLASST
jgi:hypothetical protein